MTEKSAEARRVTPVAPHYTAEQRAEIATILEAEAARWPDRKSHIYSKSVRRTLMERADKTPPGVVADAVRAAADEWPDTPGSFTWSWVGQSLRRQAAELRGHGSATAVGSEWLSLIKPGDVISLPGQTVPRTVLTTEWLADTKATVLVVEGVDEPVTVPLSTLKLPIYNRPPVPPMCFSLGDDPADDGDSPAEPPLVMFDGPFAELLNGMAGGAE